MDLTESGVDLTDARTLRLGGVAFWLAPLMLRQMVRIGPRLPDVLAILNRRAMAATRLSFDDHGAPFFASTEESCAYIKDMSISETESHLLVDIVHVALSRVYPRLKVDDLLDLPIAPGALIEAANSVVAASQTTERKARASGEAGATSR